MIYAYRLEVFYQPKDGVPHEEVSFHRLTDLIGWTLSDNVHRKASNRMTERTLPEVKVFFNCGGRQVILADRTNRGNVYTRRSRL